jgi:hypothetical protein
MSTTTFGLDANPVGARLAREEALSSAESLPLKYKKPRHKDRAFS